MATYLQANFSDNTNPFNLIHDSTTMPIYAIEHIWLTGENDGVHLTVDDGDWASDHKIFYDAGNTWVDLAGFKLLCVHLDDPFGHRVCCAGTRLVDVDLYIASYNPIAYDTSDGTRDDQVWFDTIADVPHLFVGGPSGIVCYGFATGPIYPAVWP